MLENPTLVLNRLWMPIDVTSVKRAMIWLARGVAKVIQPDTYELHDFNSWADLSVAVGELAIRTVDKRIRVPEIVLLTTYSGIPDGHVVFSRRNLFRRDKSTCQYCGGRPGTEELTIDHILPRSRGGTSTWENCVLACVDCNRTKSNRLPDECGMALLADPKRPKWTPLGFGRSVKIHASWEKFVSDRYWNAELEE